MFRLEEGEAPAGFPQQHRAALAAPEGLAVARMVPDADGNPPSDGWLSWDPGMPSVFKGLTPLWLLAAMGFFITAIFFAVTRWWRLLAVAGCPTTWFNALRLTYLGLFFNFVVPGLTGGDVIKAVLVARNHAGRRAEAFMSVWVDRILGLFTLALLAAGVVFALGDALAELKLPLVAFAGALFAGGMVYLSGPIRRLFRVDALLAKLPLGDKLKTLDEAVLCYRGHNGTLTAALVLSMANHSFSILGVWALGMSFGVAGDVVSVGQYFALVPVANMISSLPIAPAGLGVGEAAYGYLFEMAGAGAALGVAISITFRVAWLLLGLIGGLFLLLPGGKVDLEETLAEAAAPSEATERTASTA